MLVLQDTGLQACLNSSALGASGCQLHPSLEFSSNVSDVVAGLPLRCPNVLLTSFAASTVGWPAPLKSMITTPYPQPSPGQVISGPGFIRFFNCSCAAGMQLSLSAGSAASCTPLAKPPKKWIVILVLVAVLPLLFFVIGAVLFIRCAAQA